MEQRVCVFVDGENLRHSIVDAFEDQGLFQRQLGQEKAVDVKLACDMLMFRQIYDVAIIVSGDQDYVPAVEIAKDSGKEVFNVAFRKMSGALIPGGARQLNIKTDDSFGVPYDDLKRHMGL